MQDIFDLLKRAGRRLGAQRYLVGLHWLSLSLAAVALLIVLASKTLPTLNHALDWRIGAPALVGLALIGTYVWWMRRRPTLLHLAIEVDERLRLNEKLSTALMCRERDDAFAQAAIDDAIAVAHRPETRSKVHESFEVRPPRRWWITPVVVSAAILCGAVIPAGDWFAKEEKTKLSAEEVARKDQIQDQYEAAVKEAAEKLKRTPDEIRDMLAAKDAELAAKERQQTADEFQRDAFKSLDALKSELRKQAESEKSQSLEQMQGALSKLNPNASGSGPASDLSKALAKGDMTKAQEALEALKKDIENGEQSPEQAQALKDLAKQIEQLAQNQQALKDALANAGINPNQMNNPQALQQAIANAQNLTDQQKQQLAAAAAAAAQADQSLQQMANALGQMGQCQGGQGDAGQAAAAAGAMAGQLSLMEMTQQDLANLNAAMQGLQNACQGLGEGLGQCQGQGISQMMAQQQWMQKMTQGGAMGNRGQGRGGAASKFATPMKLTDEKEKVSTQANSEIIGTTYIDGKTIVKGESKVTFSELVRASASRADQDLEENVLPAEYESATKVFFGELQKRADVIDKSTGSGSEGGASEPPTESAGSGGQ